MTATPETWTGATLAAGRYQVAALLEEGGMGFIYRALDRNLGSDVVIKVPRPAILEDPDFSGRFAHEVRSLVRLAHPHIVKVLDVGSHEDLPFVVLQFLPGGNLRRRLAGPLDGSPESSGRLRRAVQPSALAGWLAEIAVALDFIHGERYVHRDVKPDNILFDGRGHAYLSDFGVVKHLVDEGKARRSPVQTRIGMVLGTPHYTAPELVLGTCCDGRADQYSLAVTVFEVLSGRFPIDGPTATDVFLNHVSRAAPSLREFVPELPEGVATAVARALSKDPDDRFPNCTAFARAVLLAAAPHQAPLGPILAETVPRTRRVVVEDQAFEDEELLAPAGPGVTCSRCGKRFARKTAALSPWVPCPGCLAAEVRTGEAPGISSRDRSEPRPSGSGPTPVPLPDGRGSERPRPRPRNRVLAPAIVGGLAVLFFTLALVCREPDDNQGGPAPPEDPLAAPEHGAPDERASGPLDRPRPGGVRFLQEPAQRLLPAAGAPDLVEPPADADTKSEFWALKGHARFITAVSFSPDGRRLASASADRTVKVWDLNRGRPALTLRGHTDTVWGVSFSPDGRRLASASADRTVRLWDLETGQELFTLAGHGRGVTGVSFSPDGRRLASASWDQTVKVWDLIQGRELLTLRGHDRGLTAVAFSPDGRHLASASADQTVKVWDADAAREIFTFRGHTGWVHAVAFSPDGQRLASASEDWTVKVWDADTGEDICTLLGHTADVTSVSFSPDGQHLASGSHDKTVRVWDAGKGQEALSVHKHPNVVPAVSYSPDGRSLATACWDRVVRLFNVRQAF